MCLNRAEHMAFTTFLDVFHKVHLCMSMSQPCNSPLVLFCAAKITQTKANNALSCLLASLRRLVLKAQRERERTMSARAIRVGMVFCNLSLNLSQPLSSCVFRVPFLTLAFLPLSLSNHLKHKQTRVSKTRGSNSQRRTN